MGDRQFLTDGNSSDEDMQVMIFEEEHEIVESLPLLPSSLPATPTAHANQESALFSLMQRMNSKLNQVAITANAAQHKSSVAIDATRQQAIANSEMSVSIADRIEQFEAHTANAVEGAVQHLEANTANAIGEAAQAIANQNVIPLAIVTELQQGMQQMMRRMALLRQGSSNITMRTATPPERLPHVPEDENKEADSAELPMLAASIDASPDSPPSSDDGNSDGFGSSRRPQRRPTPRQPPIPAQRQASRPVFNLKNFSCEKFEVRNGILVSRILYVVSSMQSLLTSYCMEIHGPMRSP